MVSYASDKIRGTRRGYIFVSPIFTSSPYFILLQVAEESYHLRTGQEEKKRYIGPFPKITSFISPPKRILSSSLCLHGTIYGDGKELKNICLFKGENVPIFLSHLHIFTSFVFFHLFHLLLFRVNRDNKEENICMRDKIESVCIYAPLSFFSIYTITILIYLLSYSC